MDGFGSERFWVSRLCVNWVVFVIWDSRGTCSQVHIVMCGLLPVVRLFHDEWTTGDSVCGGLVLTTVVLSIWSGGAD